MRFVVENLDDFGRGIIYLDNKITFVSNTLIGEEIEVLDYRESKKYNVVTEFNFIKKNNDRVDSECPYFNECGGCQLRHMSIKTQLKYKDTKALNIMRKFAKIDNNINKIVNCNSDYYRNKIVLHINGDKIGFYKDGCKDLVIIDKCLLVNSKINDFILRIKRFIVDNKNLTEAIIRVVNDKIMIAFVGEVNSLVLSNYFDVDSLYLNGVCIKGNEVLEEIILNKRFVVSLESFFQVNKDMTEIIYQKIIDYVKELGASNVLDLYCGTGTIGMLVSDYVNTVVGVEVVEKAVNDAIINKDLNEVKNISFQKARVEELEINDSFDTVIVDPPRKGLDKKVIDNLLENKYKNIIYMSCDLVTLARDINLLSEVYEVKEMSTYDMFPNTYHVETVCLLKRI